MVVIPFDKEKIRACIQIAACICGKDGVISELEEQAIVTLVSERFPDFTLDDIERALSDFFNSNQQIEDYLILVDDVEHRRFALYLAEKSASADGLNVKENIALEKAYLVWDIKHNA